MRGENNACALNALRGNARQPVIRVLILYFNSNYEGLWNLKKKKKRSMERKCHKTSKIDNTFLFE